MKQVDQTDRRGAPRVVRNISRTGATLEIDHVDPVPDMFWLHLEHEGFSTECIVVWRSETVLSVAFEPAPVM